MLASEGERSGQGAENTASGGWRIALLVGAIAATMGVAYLTPLRGYFSDPLLISARLHDLGPAAPLAFTAAVALLVALGVPRLLLCAAGGLTFGFLQGLLWSQVGTLIGCYATFLFARWSGREYLLRRFPALAKHEPQMRGTGWWAVVIARQIPVTGLFVNLALGFTRVRHRDFLLGTAFGILPEAIPATLVGAGAVQGSLGRATLYLSVAFVAACLLVLTVRHVVRSKAVPSPGASQARAPGRAENP